MTRISCAILIGFLFITSGEPVHAQDVIELPLVVQSGDLLQISYSHERNENGQTNGARIVGEILIGDVDQDSLHATWTTISIEAGGVLIDSSSPEAPTLLVGIPIGYIADGAGTPVRMEDKGEVLDLLMESIEVNRGGESVNLDALAKTRALFDSMNDEALAGALLKVPAFLAICQGTALEPGQAREAEVEVPSPVGTSAIRSVVTYLLEGIDEEEGMAQVEYRSILNPTDTEQLVSDLLTQLVGPEGIPESELTGMSIERNDSASCEVNIESGVAESVTVVSEMKVLDQSRTETLIFSVVHSSAGSE